jgi:hypothetical protein
MTILHNAWRILQADRLDLCTWQHVLMSKRTRSGISRAVDRTKVERQELAERIGIALPRDGKVELQPGLTLYRASPTISQVDVASAEEPYLALRLVLDPAVVTSCLLARRHERCCRLAPALSR